MTDTQILTVAIAVVFPVLGIIGAITAVLYSNKRLDSFEAAINKRLDSYEASLDKRLVAFEAGIDKRLITFEVSIDQRFEAFEKRMIERLDHGFEHMELLLKLHEAEHHK